MNYTVDYLADKKIVSIKNNGRLNFQHAEQYSKEAVVLARKNDCTKFIIDHSETSMEAGINKLHTNGDVLQQFGFKNSDCIAIVISKINDEDIIPAKENGNAHLSNTKYFETKNIQDAYEWLSAIEQD